MTHSIDHLVAAARASGIKLWEENGSLRFRAPAGAMTTELRDRIKANRKAIIDTLRAENAPVLRGDPEHQYEPFSLTDIQTAYLLGRSSSFQGGGTACHAYLEIDMGPIDAASLENAFDRLIERHGMLRTSFHRSGYQQTHPRHEIRRRPITVVDTAQLPRLRDRLSHQILDADHPPLMELAISRGERPTDDRLHLSIDFLVADWTSMTLMIDQLVALHADPHADLGPEGPSFRDYVVSTELDEDSPRAAQDHRFWADRLKNIPRAPELPAPTATGLDGPVSFTRHAHALDVDATCRFMDLARSINVSPAALAMSGYAKVLGEWAQDPEFTLVATLLDRQALHPHIDALVGDFTSTGLVRVSRTDTTDAERARTISQELADVLDHRAYSGVAVMRDLARLSGGTQLTFPYVFTAAIDTASGRRAGQSLAWRITGGITQTPQVFIDCQVSVLGGCLCVNWDVRDGTIEPSVVDAMFRRFTVWLTGEAGETLSGSEAMHGRALGMARAESPSFVGGGGCCLHGRFFEVAGADPGRVAVIDEQGEHGFGEVARRALAVAAVLRGGGLRPGDRVLVSCPRGVGQVVAVLGVLAAGGCYVPVDVGHPRARRERIAGICGARVVVDESWLARVPVLEDPFGVEVSLDSSLDAYVVFTSGTTGEPKGVVMTHEGAMNTIADVVARWAVTADDRALLVSSLGFDLSVFDLFGVLGRGGSLVIPPAGRYADPVVWADLVARYRVSVWNSAPAQLSMVLEAAPVGRLSSVRLVLVSGDWVPVDLGVRLWAHNPVMRVVALGGATEAGIWSNFHVLRAGDEVGSSIPYGVALSGQCMDVVDGSWRARPDLVAGDIVISGGSLARCYESDPELTASKFVVVEGVRWYRTGDRGRWLPSGEIEFLGRTDTQVKVHGHRIELKEIEHAISTHPEVMEVAVVASEGRTRQMYAAVVTRPGARLTVDELVGWQEQQIPWPCTLLSFFDELPLNRNGKVDREAVLARLMAEHPDGGPIAGSPLGPLEAAVAAYWYEYLSVPVRSADDDFFLLGGDSLIASRVIAAMRREGWTTSLAEVFTHPRLGDYAKTCVPPQGIREDQASALAHDADHAYEPFGLTEVQRAYLVGRDPELTLGGVDCIFYREYRVEEVDEQRLGRAIDTVVARHPMLRTVFEGTSQRVLAEVGPYRVVRSAGAEAERMRRELSGRAFEPDRWPLFDVRVLEFDGSPHICVTTDSIVMDAASVLIFQREVDAAYAGHELEAPPEIDFRDYVVGYLEDEALSGERRSAALTYWREHARELPPSPALPLARSPEELGVPGIERRTIQIDAGQWELLRERCRREAVTPSVLVLASFCEAMRAFSGQSAVSVAVTVFDRPEVHPQIDRVLGDFTSLVVAAYRASGEQDWATRVKDVSHELAHDLENFSVGMGAIGRLAQEAGATSAFPVVFTSALGIEQTFGGDRGLFRECTGGTSATPQVWLDHQISDDGQGGVRINWDHVVGLFPEGLIESAMAHQKALLDFASEQSWDTSPPAAITERERETRRCFEEPAEAEPRLLHADLVALARTVPDEPALVGPDGRILSRGALMDRASRVCAVLSHEGVGAGEQVMIRLSDPVSRVAAIYGVLMAGGSYVPVGADHPRRRVDSIIAQTGLRTVIDDDWMLRLEGSAGPTATSWGPGPARPEDPAYTIFTSGSTGEPKGVVLSHEAAAATIDAVHARWKPREGWRGLAVSAVDFDLSVFDLFGCLGSGGLLVLVGEQHRRDSQSWARLVREHQVNYWNTVPTLLEMLLVSAGPGDLTSLRPVLVSGDRVPLDLDSRLIEASPRAMLVALGGATECAIWSNWFEPTGDESWRQQSPAWDSVPYGHPLPGQRFDVLTAEGEPCPDWVVGELTISGCGVAEGYVGEDQGGFRVDSAGRRSYRTGDLGRFRPGGLLEILGRLDDQVKVRGHRIATGEVEAAAESLPGIERAVAGVIEGEDGAILALACVPTTAALRGETGRVEVDPVHAEGSPSHFGLPARAIRVAAVLREVISRTHRDDGTLRVLEFWEAWLAGQEIGRLLVEDIPVVELLADVLARRRPLADLGTERATDVMAQMNDQEESACALEWMLRSARKIIDGSSASYVGLWASTAVAHELAGRIGGIEADRDHLVPTGESEVWAGRGFDLVLAPFSMHTFARPERAMRRAVRALRPGGHLVMTEIGRLAPEALLSAVLLEDGFGPDGSRASDPMRGHCHDLDEWAELAVRFGLRPTAAISVEGSTVYGLVLQRPGEDEELDGERLRAQLAERLAAPYVPRLCEIIDAVPMTRNGKVDRMTVMAALRVGGAGALGGGEAPGAGLESLVAECWQSLLGASGISRTDSLFDHGGDSLSAARLVVELERRTGVRLSLRRILESPTVQGIAESLAIAGADDNGEGFEEGEL